MINFCAKATKVGGFVLSGKVNLLQYLMLAVCFPFSCMQPKIDNVCG